MAAFYREHGQSAGLRTGITMIAVGHLGPHNTLSAMGVLQSSPGGPSKLRVGNCSPASIDDAITTALINGADPAVISPAVRHH